MTRNHMGSPRIGSNPVDVVGDFFFILLLFMLFFFFVFSLSVSQLDGTDAPTDDAVLWLDEHRGLVVLHARVG